MAEKKKPLTKEERNAKFLADWPKMMELGLVKFALIHGAIFGLLVGGFTCIIDLFTTPKSDWSLQTLGTTMLFFIVASIVVYGPLEWWMNNKKYQQLKK